MDPATGIWEMPKYLFRQSKLALAPPRLGTAMAAPGLNWKTELLLKKALSRKERMRPLGDASARMGVVDRRGKNKAVSCAGLFHKVVDTVVFEDTAAGFAAFVTLQAVRQWFSAKLDNLGLDTFLLEHGNHFLDGLHGGTVFVAAAVHEQDFHDILLKNVSSWGLDAMSSRSSDMRSGKMEAETCCQGTLCLQGRILRNTLFSLCHISTAGTLSRLPDGRKTGYLAAYGERLHHTPKDCLYAAKPENGTWKKRVRHKMYGCRQGLSPFTAAKNCPKSVPSLHSI